MRYELHAPILDPAIRTAMSTATAPEVVRHNLVLRHDALQGCQQFAPFKEGQPEVAWGGFLQGALKGCKRHLNGAAQLLHKHGPLYVNDYLQQVSYGRS